MDSEPATTATSKATALKAVAIRGSKVATDVIALEYQSLVGDFAFSAADRTAFAVAILNQIDEYMTSKFVAGKSVVSPAGQAIIRTHALECSKSFGTLQNAANTMKQAYRRAERDRNGKTDQWTSQGLDWPLVKAQFHYTTESLESPTRTLLLILHVVKLAHSRMVSERSWDESPTRHRDDLERAIVALHKNPRIADSDDLKPPSKVLHEPTKLGDILEESGEENEKAESNTAVSEKMRVENIRPQKERGGPKTVIEDRRDCSTDSKDETAVSIRSRRSRDTESIIILRERNIFQRVLLHLPFLRRFSSPAETIDPEIHPLELYMHKPFLTHHNDGFELRWGTCKHTVPYFEVMQQLARDQKKAKASVAEQLARLTPDEDDRLQIWRRNLPFKATIVSLWRESITLNAHGITIKDLPTFRIIIHAEPFEHIVPIPRNLHEAPPGERFIGAGAGIPAPQGPLPGSRPTYVKVHRRHMEPTTLNVYNLPWEWDHATAKEGLCRYIIIKTWVPECDQDVLFEHTRKLREMGLVAPGSQGISPTLRLEKARRYLGRNLDERIEIDTEAPLDGFKGKDNEEKRVGKKAWERLTFGVQEEKELVDRLLREYTIWSGEGTGVVKETDNGEEGEPNKAKEAEEAGGEESASTTKSNVL